MNKVLLWGTIPEASTFKYAGIICSDPNWADHVNYILRKAWMAHHLMMSILKKENNNTKRLPYMALVRPILGCGAVCSDPYRGQVSALLWEQKRAANNKSQVGKLTQRRLIAGICALFEAYNGNGLGKR
jgi:hypothetical protein